MFGDVSTMVHFAGVQRTLKEQQVIENEVYSYERHIQHLRNMQRHDKEQRVKENERTYKEQGGK